MNKTLNEKKKAIISKADIDLVNGLILGDEKSESKFKKRYQKMISGTIDDLFIELNKLHIKTKLTKKELSFAFYNNLHIEDNKQLRTFLEKKDYTLDEFMSLKAPIFCRDMIIVKGLKENDNVITTKLLYGEGGFSLKPTFKRFIDIHNITDPANYGKKMTPECLGQLVAKQFLEGLNRFKFICSLKSFVSNDVLKSWLKIYNKERNISRNTDDIDGPQGVVAYDIIDSCDFDVQELHEFFEKLFTFMINVNAKNQKFVDVLKYKYYDGLSNKEIAEIMSIKMNMIIKDNLISQWATKAKKNVREASKKFDEPDFFA